MSETADRDGGQGLVARTWRGWTRREDADAYVAYLEQTGMPGYRLTADREVKPFTARKTVAGTLDGEVL